MERAKKVKINITVALLHQLVTVISGLILPRFILLYFGSEVNGLLQSISQFLSYTTLLECGIGGLVLAALYEPLAKKDNDGISTIFNNTKKYFKKISFIFIAFSLVLAMAMKLIVSTGFDRIYTSTLVLVLALDTYLSYYLGVTHVLLLKADQRLFVVQSTQIITILLNFAVSILIITLGGSIHFVKFASAFIFLLNPLAYRWFVKRYYKINKNANSKEVLIPEKKDGFIHHISYFIHRNTDIVILSVFSGVVNASVYAVYNAVIMVTERLLTSFSSGVSGAFGNMIAKKEKNTLSSSFSMYESFNTFITMSISTVTAVLIIPFVKIYTSGVTDVNYIQPVFAYLMIGGAVMYCIRIPYGLIVNSAGHYKQTRSSAIVEATLNIGVSLIFVRHLGLSGVALGTFLAMTYRTIYIVEYLSRNILYRPSWLFYKSFIANTAVAALAVFLSDTFISFNIGGFGEFFLTAAWVSAVIFPVFAVLNVVLSKETRVGLKGYITSKRHFFL